MSLQSSRWLIHRGRDTMSLQGSRWLTPLPWRAGVESAGDRERQWIPGVLWGMGIH